MRLMLVASLLALPSLALAGAKVEECVLDIPASEGAYVVIHSDADGPRAMIAAVAGHTGSFEMRITPLGGEDAVIEFMDFAYAQHVNEPGAPVVSVAWGGRAIVTGGTICAAEGCWSASDVADRATVEGAYAEFLAAWPGRHSCTVLWGG